MPSEVNDKPFNIYINPSFNNQQKNFIHINPNVQLNVAVHFNPKMVNSLSASQFNKINQQQIQHVRQLSHNVPSVPDVLSVNSKLNVQKSVYVNPKLIQQLKSKVPDVQQQTPISILSPSKFVSKQTLISKNNIINNHNNYIVNNTRKFLSNNVNNKRVLINNNKSLNNINTKSINVKKSSPSLISISKRKLIRVKPVTKFVLNNSPVKKIPVVVKKSPVKLNLEQVRKVVSTSPVTKSVRLSPVDQAAKKLPSATKSLKLNNLSQYKKVNPRVAAKSSPVAGKSLKLNLNQYKKINPRAVTKSSPVAVKLPKINNFSQYKKINTRGLAGTSSRVKSNVGCSSSDNKYKLDRTKVEKKKIVNKNRISRCKPARSTNTNLIKIDGVMYKSSKSQLVKSSGSSQSLLKKFNTVNRNSINNYRSKNIYRQIKSNSKITNLKSISTKVVVNKDSATTTTLLQRSNYKNFLSNRVKQRSIQILRHKMTKNNQPCLLFQRFGFCAKFNEGTCPKVHDKKQVALCKNFLQGKCLLDNCRLSHDVGPEKMPTCKYFLDGCCVRDSCQYLHVKVSANTPICIPFLQGYCGKGDQCKERHTNICPEFEKTEKCSKGKNCPYPHKSSTTAQNPKVFTKKKAKAITTFNKQPAIDNEKSDAPSSSNALSIRDDTKKRYYDNDDCFDDTLASKKINIFKKLKIIKSHLSDSEQNHPSVALDSSVVIENNSNAHQQQPDKSSQPDSINFSFKRQPIGPLPAYIPI